jgi:hypothetical protein
MAPPTLFVVLVGWLWRYPPRIDAAHGTTTLRFRGVVRSTALFCLALAVAFLVEFVRLVHQPTREQEAFLVISGFAGTITALTVWLGLAGFRSRVVLSAAGFTHHPWLGRPRHWRWDEVAAFRYSNRGHCYEFRSDVGRRLRLSDLYDGIHLLPEMLQRYWERLAAELPPCHG